MSRASGSRCLDNVSPPRHRGHGEHQRQLHCPSTRLKERGSLRMTIEKKTTTFNTRELRTLRSLRTPARIQKFLDDMRYHHASTAWSPRLVLEHRQAHCLEGAIFAAAALRVNGFPALLWDLESVRDDDHVLAVFQENKRWGAIGK